ncbi:MAG: energy transducer TonB [Bacteroidota bacterium]
MKKVLYIALLKSLLATLLLLPTGNAEAQDQEKSYLYLEEIQDENVETLHRIFRITREYPAFSYEYEFENGVLKNLIIRGVDDNRDWKRLSVMLIDLKSDRNKINNKKNRIGVYYSVDKEAEPVEGEEEFRREIRQQIVYPENAENRGIEGTLFGMVVVDEEGEIPFVAINEDVETSRENLLKDMEKELVAAIKETSGEWEPAKVEGEKVPSLVVIPVKF